jgi:hypothetical protein
MANTFGPRHGGGTMGRVRVRGGSLTLRIRSVARVRGDRGRAVRPSPEKNMKTMMT